MTDFSCDIILNGDITRVFNGIFCREFMTCSYWDWIKKGIEDPYYENKEMRLYPTVANKNKYMEKFAKFYGERPGSGRWPPSRPELSFKDGAIVFDSLPTTDSMSMMAFIIRHEIDLESPIESCILTSQDELAYLTAFYGSLTFFGKNSISRYFRLHVTDRRFTYGPVDFIDQRLVTSWGKFKTFVKSFDIGDGYLSNTYKDWIKVARE